jgi:hypothetical protein
LFELTGPLLNRWLAPFYTGVDKIGERTVDGLWNLIGRLVDIFQPDECAN